MIRSLFLILTGISIGLSSCSTIDVSSESSPTAQLSTYRTFAWAPRTIKSTPGTQEVSVNTILDQRIRPTLEANLEQIGIMPAKTGQSPDFLITYSARTRNQVGVTEAYPDYWDGFGYYGFPGYAVPEPYEFKEGTLTVTFVDPKTKSVVWRGVAEEAIDDSKDHIKIRGAVEKLVANFNDARKDQAKKYLAER